MVVVYFGLLYGAISGIVNLEEGLDSADLTPDGSYYRTFMKRERMDFSGTYGPLVQVAITEEVDYTDQVVLNNIDSLMANFQDSEYFVDDDRFLISWLNSYLLFLSQANINASDLDMPTFIALMRKYFFLIQPFQHFEIDVVFNDDYTAITTSRFFMQTGIVNSSLRENAMMLNSRKLVDDFVYGAEVFSIAFPLYDQSLIIYNVTLTNLGIAVACMFAVALVLIPSISTIFWVTMANMSIGGLVIGYMSLWGVRMDPTSMMNLIMCIGFSVDFAAHICYHYVIQKGKDPKVKVSAALGYLGVPILQGAASSILGVLFLAFTNVYMFRTFFKIVFMVMVFGTFHAMFLLPVVISTLDFSFCFSKSSTSKKEVCKNSVLNGVENRSFEHIYT